MEVVKSAASCLRNFCDCKRQTMRMTRAFGTGATSEGIPCRVSVVVSVWMSSAPMSEPSRVKRPPVSTVPPTTTAVMASTFGLLIAALGKTPGGTRGIASLSVLLMVMLGGAWVPSFIFPAWLQKVTVVVPARWAVDGFDAMTWRGLGFQAAVLPSAVMLGFAVLFGTLALARFRWEEQ